MLSIVMSAPLESLEAAAESTDMTAFLTIWNGVDWERLPAVDLLAAIRLALRIDAHALARDLAALGHALYPQHDELATAAHILAPPTVQTTQRADHSDQVATYDWLKQHAPEYRGKWVAIRSGELLAVADAASEIISQLGDIRHKGILLTQLW